MYTEASPGFSHIPSPESLITTWLPQSCVCKVASGKGKWDASSEDRRGNEQFPITWVQLSDHLVVMSSGDSLQVVIIRIKQNNVCLAHNAVTHTKEKLGYGHYICTLSVFRETRTTRTKRNWRKINQCKVSKLLRLTRARFKTDSFKTQKQSSIVYKQSESYIFSVIKSDCMENQGPDIKGKKKVALAKIAVHQILGLRKSVS